MNKKKFLTDYIKEFCDGISLAASQNKKILSICDTLSKTKSKNCIHIFGGPFDSSIILFSILINCLRLVTSKLLIYLFSSSV